MRPRLTYANFMATIAVFIALGGSAYAATQLKKNSVGTKQLKNSAVTPTKLSAAAKAALTGSPGAKGEMGTKGEKGERGLQGPAGATNLTVVTTPLATGYVKAECPEGTVATGGGGVAKATDPEAVLWRNRPIYSSGGPPTGWEAAAIDSVSKSGAEAEAFVVCASP